MMRCTARFAINGIMDLEDTTNSEKKLNFHATKSLPKLALDVKVKYLKLKSRLQKLE
jgi:hypothetical protein